MVTLYCKKHNIEFYNIHKNGQTSFLNTFDHKDKSNIDRIEWIDINTLPEKRYVICIYRDIYDRCISSFLYITKSGLTEGNVLEKFKQYLIILKNHGFNDSHNLPQIYFINNKVRHQYHFYKNINGLGDMSDRDKNNVTHFIDIKNIDKIMLKLFNVKIKHDNTALCHNFKQILKRNIATFKGMIGEIYVEDIRFLNYIKSR
ncbi:MAG: hypothetical protein GY727_06890 [Gammaproteobacteria bacterium]|nr:hypothetical protein [Gammaproteobacteria bacterium]